MQFILTPNHYKTRSSRSTVYMQLIIIHSTVCRMNSSTATCLAASTTSLSHQQRADTAGTNLSINIKSICRLKICRPEESTMYWKLASPKSTSTNGRPPRKVSLQVYFDQQSFSFPPYQINWHNLVMTRPRKTYVCLEWPPTSTPFF